MTQNVRGTKTGKLLERAVSHAFQTYLRLRSGIPNRSLFSSRHVCDGLTDRNAECLCGSSKQVLSGLDGLTAFGLPYLSESWRVGRATGTKEE